MNGSDEGTFRGGTQRLACGWHVSPSKGCRPRQRRDYSMIKLSVIIICVGLNYELVYTLFNGLRSGEIAIMGWEACQRNDLFDILWDAITRGLLYKDCYRLVSSLFSRTRSEYSYFHTRHQAQTITRACFNNLDPLWLCPFRVSC